MRKSFVIALLFLVGCSPSIDRKEAPDNLIKEKEMVEVMTELMKLEGHVQTKYTQLTQYYKVIDNSADSLFKAHGYTAKQFQQSFEYYADQQGELLKIYQQVLDNLSKELVELELEEQKRPKDSIH